jgi:ribosomal protein S18 acetylase RimI-like enzyme
MTVRMPKLEEGKVYHREEVAPYIGTQSDRSDFDVAALHFPRNLRTWEADVLAWRDREEILLQYMVFDLTEFKEQIRAIETDYMKREDHRERVEAIVEKLMQGNPFYPVLMQQNDLQRRIIEGQHRSIALLRLESECLPTFLMGYGNWFTEKELLRGFDREDEIILASLKDVFHFFRHATCIDQRGIVLALFDSERLRECDEALVARFRGQIVGAVTVKVKKGTPTLQTIYTLKQYRRKGVAYRLCVEALLRFQAAGVGEVFCDVQSEGTAAILARLERRRPELWTMVKAYMGYSPGVGIEIDEDIEVMKES